MPDGSQLPPLNGVREAGDPTWPHDRPYAKVVGTKTVNGIDYYVHADGSTTTTIMVWRTDLGRYDAATHVVNPVGNRPLADDELPGQPGHAAARKGP
jgi:hypothetical protein